MLNFFTDDDLPLLFTGNIPRGVSVNKVHRNTRELSLRSKRYFLCLSQEGSFSVHREARYGERSERNDLPEAGLQGDFFYRHFEWIRYIM